MLQLRKLLWNNKEKKKVMKISVAGTGYVGLSNAIISSQHNKVYAVTIQNEKLEELLKKIRKKKKNFLNEPLSSDLIIKKRVLGNFNNCWFC